MPLKTMEELSGYLKKIKFRRKVVGGIDEEDVWAVIGRLQKEYRSILEATEQRSQGLLTEREKIIRSQRAEIDRLKKAIGSQSPLRPTGGADG